jgi:hypothetical protein
LPPQDGKELKKTHLEPFLRDVADNACDCSVSSSEFRKGLMIASSKKRTGAKLLSCPKYNPKMYSAAHFCPHHANQLRVLPDHLKSHFIMSVYFISSLGILLYFI